MTSIIVGFIVSFVVRFLKGVPFIAKNPKVVAGVLAALASVVTVLCLHCASLIDALKGISDQLGAIAIATVTAASVATYTHEVAKPVLPSQTGGPSH